MGRQGQELDAASTIFFEHVMVTVSMNGESSLSSGRILLLLHGYFYLQPPTIHVFT